MLLYKIKQNQTGSALLVISMLVLAFVLVLALGASAVVRNGILMGRNQVESTKAFFAAEAGAERILWEIWQGDTDPHAICTENVESKFCFDAFPVGDINECVDINNSCSSDIETQELSNKALYSINYIYLNERATSTIRGNFADINSRVIKLIQ